MNDKEIQKPHNQSSPLTLKVCKTYSFANIVVIHKVHCFHLHLLQQLLSVIHRKFVLLQHRYWVFIVGDFSQKLDAVGEVMLVTSEQITVLLGHC